jgi:hypothetical protein
MAPATGYIACAQMLSLNTVSDRRSVFAIAGSDPWASATERLDRAPPHPVTGATMATASFHPLEEHPTAHAAAMHYRKRAKVWRESAMAVPEGAPQQAVCPGDRRGIREACRPL